MVLRDKVWIRSGLLPGLILSFCLAACLQKRDIPSAIAIKWDDSVATGFVVPRQLVSTVSDDSVRDGLRIHLVRDTPQPPVLGEYRILNDEVIFQPLIPFTRGLTYEVRFKNQSLATIRIPPVDPARAPELIAIYPTQDTLPENLLKMYLEFSQPMKETDPLSYVRLVRNGRDTMPEVFLDLRPALWNNEGTLLTLWLDPGRIKRDLQPNKSLGAPLLANQTYKLVIDKRWPSKSGALLKRSSDKTFFAGARDNLSPDLALCNISIPRPGTKDPLRIDLPETLDCVLLKEAIDVIDSHAKSVEGKVNITDEETVLLFIPAAEWQRGSYFLRSESRLEDLAGNNLNRLFDRDMTVQQAEIQKDFHKLEFTIR
ncbi:MAG: hypothetical protein WD824_27130 [Cyclobacteriaceae bacterium]